MKFMKVLGAIAAVGAVAMFISMYPDFKRYMKLESM